VAAQRVCPPGVEQIENASVAPIAGEFSVGQDGAASYTINIQGPKGVGNVEPAITLNYSSNSGDGVMGIGWTLGGISSISRGPATLDIDGFFDPVDFDGFDRFYLDGDRLICVSPDKEYGEHDSEYRTLREQFSRIRYKKSGTTDCFEVETKAGLKMTFGGTDLSSVRPWQNGNPTAESRVSWALNRVEDNLGNYWEVVYGELSPGGLFAEGRPYFPDYQPLAVRYTGKAGRSPAHEIRFLYERRPDQTRGYGWGALVRKEKRLAGIELRTGGTVQRSYKLRYDLASDFVAERGERSHLMGIQQFAGSWSDPDVPRQPETTFDWEQGERNWGRNEDRIEYGGVKQAVNWPSGNQPWGEWEYLRTEYRTNDTIPDFGLQSTSTYYPKPIDFIDIDGDGQNELLISHRGVALDRWHIGSPEGGFRVIHDFQQILKKNEVNGWDISVPHGACGSPRLIYRNAAAYVHPSGKMLVQLPLQTSKFPYLTTDKNVPTGAFLCDVNHDGLFDIVSCGRFDEKVFYIHTNPIDPAQSGEDISEVMNSSGIWINQGGTFVKDLDGMPESDFPVDHDANSATPSVIQDNWGVWAFPLVPTETIPTAGGAISNVPPVMRPPEFAQFKEHDLGWRLIDMDGDGDQDFIRAGAGPVPAGWLATGSSLETSAASITGTGALAARGREYCFGLRNEGPNAPPGQRWALINPSETNEIAQPNTNPSQAVANPVTHLKSIWKLPLPLVGADGKQDLGRRLIDMNGDGLPDFVAQKKRTAAYPNGTWATHNTYDLVVWLNRGQFGWEYQGSIEGAPATPWTLEGHNLGLNNSINYGRFLKDMNGDGYPDYVVSLAAQASNGSWSYQRGVFLNHGNGWVKGPDGAAVNFTSMIPPRDLMRIYPTSPATSVPMPHYMMDMTGDGRPEFFTGLDVFGTSIPSLSNTKAGLTSFMDASGSWHETPMLKLGEDWNLDGNLLSSLEVRKMQMAELTGDGNVDILRTTRDAALPGGTATYLHTCQTKSPRVTKITNGLGIPIEVTYGQLSVLASAQINTGTAQAPVMVPDPMRRYRKSATPPPAGSGLRDAVPTSYVVTDYTTTDGTENADGTGGGSITTSYYYADLKDHRTKGSLGFGRIERRTSRSPVRHETVYSQATDLLGGASIGMPVSACGYTSAIHEPFAPVESRQVLSSVDTTYERVEISAPARDQYPSPTFPYPPPPGVSLRINKRSFLVYAHEVVQQNRSPEGYYLGSTFSTNDYYLTGNHAGLLWKQDVRQDQATPGTENDDTQTLTEHVYDPPTATSSSWRIGQIQQTTVKHRRPGTNIPDVTKVSAFTYWDEGAKAGMLKEEITDPDTDFSVKTTHYYTDAGNENKTIVETDGISTPSVAETWFSDDDRFPVASMNSLGHATATNYDSNRSLAVSSTMVFKAPPGSMPSPPAGTPQTSTIYDPWGSSKVTTGPDGLRAVRLTLSFRHSSLPRAAYYVYEQAEGSTPVITYYDRHHAPLLVEKTGFNGKTIFQENFIQFRYDNQGRYIGAQKMVSQPYFASDPPPPYSIEEQDVYGRKTKVISPDGSESVVVYVGLQSFTYSLRGGSTNPQNNPRLRTHTKVVDMAERPMQVIDNVGSSVIFSYTADGLPASATTSYSGTDSAVSSTSTTITTTYNAQRLKESVLDPNTGGSWTFYDSLGRACLTRDAQGFGSATSFDSLGRPQRMLTGVPVALDNLSVTNPSAITAWISSLQTNSVGETETIYTYYDDNAPGQHSLGRAASVRFREFERDGSGAIIATHEVLETYTYDHLGRSLSSTTTLTGQLEGFNGSYTTSTTYDALGRVKTVTDPGGFTRASKYNEFGFLSGVHEGTDTGTMLWQAWDYDAQGKLLLEYHGNGMGTQNRYHPTRGFLESSRTLRWTTGAHVQEYEMQMDDLGNVLWRREQRFEQIVAGTPVVRTESFGYDRINRLTDSHATGQTTQSLTFAANGNIVSKAGIGTYTYGQRGHGPHAVTSVSQQEQVRRSYTYDPKGRMTTEHVGENLTATPLREIRYTSFDQPRFIQHWGAAALSSDQGELGDSETPWDQVCTLSFRFGPGGQRLTQLKQKGLLVTKVLSLGSYEIREVTRGGLSGALIEREERSSFGNGTKVKRWTATNLEVPTIHYEFSAKDHLGSDSATYDGQGQIKMQRGHLQPGQVQKTERQSYDAWGARRDADTWAPAQGQLGPENGSTIPAEERVGSNLPRGYTGHEMLDDVGLVHMNGRLYDPALGRMCAADRDVQAPDMVQNHNRYSYVLNNPMNAVDPSGHNWFKKVIGIIIAVIIAVIIIIVAAYALAALAQALLPAGMAGAAGTGVIGGTGVVGFLTPGAAGAFTIAGVNGAVVVAAAVGAAWSAINVTMQGGTFSQVLKSAVIGAANGAVGAMVGSYMHGLGADWGSILQGGDSLLGTAAHITAHGVSGGAMAEANGGSFQDGFIGGLVGAGTSGIGMKLYGGTSLYSSKSVWAVAGRTAISAVTGGLSAMATGGKFADGAYSAAFFHLFNNELDSLYESLDKRRLAYNERKEGNMVMTTDELTYLMESDYQAGLVRALDKDGMTLDELEHYADNKHLYKYYKTPGSERGDERTIAPVQGFRGAGFILDNEYSSYPNPFIASLANMGKAFWNWEINYYVVGQWSRLRGLDSEGAFIIYKAYYLKNPSKWGPNNRQAWFWAGYSYADARQSGWDPFSGDKRTVAVATTGRGR
jgi:RHS repeat-associated protein